MAQRLVWNFECSTIKPLSLTQLPSEKAEPFKWEARFFWPQDEIITLNVTDESLLDLSLYKQKHRDDVYYLVPDQPYNIKKRRNEILYKPLVKQAPFGLAFESKLVLDDASKASLGVDKARLVPVVKDAFIYSFKTEPTIKLELARLTVANTIYFSACIEGRSANLVEQLTKHSLGEKVSCDYVTFLTGVLNS